MKIHIDSIETFAKLNFIIDKARGLLYGESWEDLRGENMAEAEYALDEYVFTSEDADSIIDHLIDWDFEQA